MPARRADQVAGGAAVEGPAGPRDLDDPRVDLPDLVTDRGVIGPPDAFSAPDRLYRFGSGPACRTCPIWCVRCGNAEC
jgi:hypothetical protein